MIRATFVVSLAFIFLVATSFAFSLQLKENFSPYDRIEERQIHVYRDRIVIDIPEASLTRYANTNSMDPVLDEGAHGIEIVPKSEYSIHVGDIVAYQPEDNNILVAHRVIDISEDENGAYFVIKGDNVSYADPEKIRFSQIKYVLIGVLY